MSTDPLLDLATGRHRAGDLAAARRLYRQLLAATPEHALALFHCGLLELADGQPAEALELIERAAAAAPREPRHDVGLGQSLQALGRFAEAAGAFRRALVADPRSADTHFALGMALQSEGDHEGAIDAYGEAARLEPAHFAARNNLGNCLQRRGRIAEAVTAYEQALALHPQAAGAMANLGTALQGVGRFDEALLHLRGAVAAEPLVMPHAVNLGIALCSRRDFAAAAAVLEHVLAREPGNADAAFNLGNALHGQGRTREAADRYRQASLLRPGHADALTNLGNVHKELGDLTASADAYEAALRIDPASVAAMNNAGCLLRTLGRLDDAEDLLRRALSVDPLRAALHDNLGSVLKDAGDLEAAIDCFRQSLDLDPASSGTHGNLVYALSFQAERPEPVLEEAQRFAQRFADGLECAGPPHTNDRSPLRRLRIGYVSPDFRDHCQSMFTLPLLSHHDHDAFEIVCYSSVERPDDRTRRIAALADVFRDVRALSDAALAQRVRDDGIDILVDLTMHMARGRPLTFARKPAPVQVAWLAYPGTTGLSAMDYRFTDPRLDPAGWDGHYRERSIRLPDSFWCYDPLTSSVGTPVGPLPALASGHVTFGCLNNPCKLTDATLRLWGAVLQAVESARLLLLAPPGRHRARLARRLAAYGIAAERVDFAPHRSRDHYLRAYHDIDISLDTLPYNGHTTSLDSLWMGVPTITRIGETCVGRGGLSQLHQIGLRELAADSDAGFVDAAAALAGDLPRLARLRQELRSRMECSPLMDAPRYARHVEAAYRGMWTRYCTSHAGLPWRDPDATMP
jgi:predicted O-linked N-acetylglucosamine transferase (SPINDLY family)